MSIHISTLSQKNPLFQLNEYYNLNLLVEFFGVISPHDFDMGNVGYNDFHIEGWYKNIIASDPI